MKTEPWLETKEKGGSRREFSHWQLIHAVLSWTRGLSGFETFPRDENVKVALDWLIGFPGPYYLFTFRNDSFRIVFFPVSKFIVKKLKIISSKTIRARQHCLLFSNRSIIYEISPIKI